MSFRLERILSIKDYFNNMHTSCYEHDTKRTLLMLSELKVYAVVCEHNTA